MGAVLGALGFGYLTDRLGRKKLFFVTLGALSRRHRGDGGFSWNLASFTLFRFLTGAGIGGEYAAINSAIQELIPARLRGRTDLAINGSFWFGAALGARRGRWSCSIRACSRRTSAGALAFVTGAVLGLVIFCCALPAGKPALADDPWPRRRSADAVVAEIEERGSRRAAGSLPPAHARLRFRRARSRRSRRGRARAAVASIRSARCVGLSLMAAQAFFYNAIFFTYALVLARFYGVPRGQVGCYLLPFALGNFFGPLLLGRFFDSMGPQADDRR